MFPYVSIFVDSVYLLLYFFTTFLFPYFHTLLLCD
ncbi:hypothetical protein EVA_07499 [gut metagenome]|uniref:Uncharacterized protein n=1 Tax=gut metagenome TaxID=749906 RepID=J9GV43_9ZZZZ